MSNIINNLKIISITKEYALETKELIIDGLKEYFDHYDYRFNEDLNDILNFYTKQNNLLLIALYNDEVIATGGIIKEDSSTYRIVRVSVKKEYRRMKIGSTILKALEERVPDKNIVLETTDTWEIAKNFYLHNNYIIKDKSDCNANFYKSSMY